MGFRLFPFKTAQTKAATLTKRQATHLRFATLGSSEPRLRKRFRYLERGKASRFSFRAALRGNGDLGFLGCGARLVQMGALARNSCSCGLSSFVSWYHPFFVGREGQRNTIKTCWDVRSLTETRFWFVFWSLIGSLVFR